MGNANTHERRKSGVPETGLTIEDIRAPAVLFQPAEAKEQSGSEAAVATGEGVAATKTKTPPPSFETTGLYYTTRVVDPDPHRCGFRRAKMTHK
jgi:hypothetical protein